ncbi:dethiobiotin synthase [Cytophagales bacterium LB-30]|uniref:ATP-dependent dethiobiotin synthetase BioD n=1 Tax=Shiella aurantiaca TaxID=3058365 RepID=A0ABT8F590_9BACT|nr:dethiobiotin synthase [Shiella aurantiaca]MDN4165434.1 dethiobiotin synthase [Shiella aurantiaca]
MHDLFVSAIGTDSGKTLVSSILLTAFEGEYWKPIQAGKPTDTDSVRNLVGEEKHVFHPERYVLQKPASPHDAAAEEGIEIRLEDFSLPAHTRPLIVEGAGGLMVPINESQVILDLIHHLGLPVVLVANLYLGSINHTLLSADALKRKGVPVKGIIFNGEPNEASQRFIQNYTQWPVLLHVRREESVTADSINKYAHQFLKTYHEYYP